MRVPVAEGGSLIILLERYWFWLDFQDYKSQMEIELNGDVVIIS